MTSDELSGGLSIVGNGHVTRLKWHRLRRALADPEFGIEALADGLAKGASMELDLQVRADGGFAVLHDATLDRETLGVGPVRDRKRAELTEIRYRQSGRPLLLSEGMGQLVSGAHPHALLQLDMKNSFDEIGVVGVAHLTTLFSEQAEHLIVSGDSTELIVALSERMPDLQRGIDPTDRLVALWPRNSLASAEAALRAEIRGPARPQMIYLAWELILEAHAAGLDLIGLCHDEGAAVDAWTYTLAQPSIGFSAKEWDQFARLMSLKPDQITTDEAVATEAAWYARFGRTD